MVDYRACLRDVFKRLDSPLVNAPDDDSADKNIMIIAYMGKDGSHSVLSYFGEQLMDIFQSKSFSEYRTHTHDLKVIGRTESALNEDENELQYTLIKLIVSLSIFAMAKEDAIADGFPKVKGFVLSNAIGDGVVSSSLNTSFKKGTHASPDEHYRSWFIRQLSHQKYYQGEHASLPANSRFVFVEDALVNSKAAPKHIVAD